jgi:hypothetical protein
LYFSHYKTEMSPEAVREMKRATYGNQFRRLPPPDSFGENRRLLDCGAATGYLAELASETGWDAYAVEIPFSILPGIAQFARLPFSSTWSAPRTVISSRPLRIMQKESTLEK